MDNLETKQRQNKNTLTSQKSRQKKISSSPYKRQNTESCTNTFLKGDFFFLLKITFAGFITVHCELHVSNNWMELYMANREVALWPLTYLHVWFWHLTLHCMCLGSDPWAVVPGWTWTLGGTHTNASALCAARQFQVKVLQNWVLLSSVVRCKKTNKQQKEKQKAANWPHICSG